MTLPVILRPEAEDDIAAAKDWYEQQREGLGEKLVAAVDDLIARLMATPEIYQIVLRDVRRGRCGGFRMWFSIACCRNGSMYLPCCMAVAIQGYGSPGSNDLGLRKVSSFMNKSNRALLCLFLSGGLAGGLAGCARHPVAVPQGAVNAQNPMPQGTRIVAKDKSSSTSSTPGEGRYFAEDSGGQMLAELLRPVDLPPLKPTEPISSPRQFMSPLSLMRSELAVPSSQASLPRPPLDARATPIRPHSLPEAAPFSTYRTDPQLPQRVSLPAGGRVRLPSLDIYQPTPLPFLAQPVSDRAPLDDPTGTSSTQAALAAVPPVRSEPVPFVRMPLPDPFELHHTVRLRLPLPEDPSPYASASRP